jgi:myosin heavy subunit
VPGPDVVYTDNSRTVGLLLGLPVGIFAILDEEARFPNGTDSSFGDKLTVLFRADGTASAEGVYLHNPLQPATFGVQHYAGAVEYTLGGMLVPPPP